MAWTKSSMMNISDILGQYSIEHMWDELILPRLNREDRSFVPPKYLYIKKLISVVLDLYKVQYTCWSVLFQDTARNYNLLHHIDPTIIIIDDDDTTLWHQQDAVVLSWIYATISPYLLVRLNTLISPAKGAMNVWACLRDLCQQLNAAMQNKKKKTRLLHIHPNEDYQGVEDNINHRRRDLISLLPDDVLLYMLFLVGDIKTAGRTCLLSKRWTHVWTHLMHLDFNDPTSGTLTSICFAQPEMDKFVDMVNRVVNENRASYLDTFRIHFPLNNSYAADIRNWLKFAFAKEVHNLDLTFGAGTYPRIHFSDIFSKDPALIFNTTLISLHLQSVTVKGPLLQWLLTNCLNLQRLSLHSCKASADDHSASFKLVVSSLELKHLEFFHSLKSLNIKVLHLCAPNLTSFILYGSKIDVEYHSVPSFVDATFGSLYSDHVLKNMDSLSGLSSQLEKLSIRWYKVSSRLAIVSSFPTLVNVQQLEIVIDAERCDVSLSTFLIKACPLLHTFKLKMMSCNQLFDPGNISENAIRSHQHLKVVQYVGYAGCQYATELAMCIAWNAPMIQRFILDTRPPQYIENLRKVYSSDYRDQTRIMKFTQHLARRIQMRRRLHPIDVVIL